MPFAVSDIVLGLALAALIGAAVGWLLRGLRRDAAAHSEQDRLITLELDRAAARGREQALAAAVRGAEERAVEQGRVAERDLAAAKAQVAGLMQERTTHAQARSESEARSARLQADLEQRERELRGTLARIIELERQDTRLSSELPEPAPSMDTDRGELAQMELALRDAGAESDRLKAQLAEVESSRQAELAEREKRHQEQQVARRALQDELEAIKVQQENLEALRIERDELARVASEQGVRLQRLTQDLAELKRQAPDPAQLKTLEAETDRLRARLAEREQDLEEFRRAALVLASGSLGSPLRAPVDHGARPPARQRRGSRASRDDLKRIRGIGPVLERTLNRLGITRFSQIAQWQASDVERVAPALGDFPDRVKRDRWIERAREEHIRKYGHDPLNNAPASTE
jgi:predicted flap endonuclease-1-like 5' DNA nuclease